MMGGRVETFVSANKSWVTLHGAGSAGAPLARTSAGETPALPRLTPCLFALTHMVRANFYEVRAVICH